MHVIMASWTVIVSGLIIVVAVAIPFRSRPPPEDSYTYFKNTRDDSKESLSDTGRNRPPSEESNTYFKKSQEGSKESLSETGRNRPPSEESNTYFKKNQEGSKESISDTSRNRPPSEESNTYFKKNQDGSKESPSYTGSNQRRSDGINHHQRFPVHPAQAHKRNERASRLTDIFGFDAGEKVGKTSHNPIDIFKTSGNILPANRLAQAIFSQTFKLKASPTLTASSDGHAPGKKPTQPRDKTNKTSVYSVSEKLMNVLTVFHENLDNDYFLKMRRFPAEEKPMRVNTTTDSGGEPEARSRPLSHEEAVPSCRHVEGYDDHQHIEMVNYCPQGWTNQTVAYLCLGAALADYVMTDTLVQSKQGGTVYANRYCALCNGVRRIVPWKTAWTCDHSDPVAALFHPTAPLNVMQMVTSLRRGGLCTMVRSPGIPDSVQPCEYTVSDARDHHGPQIVNGQGFVPPGANYPVSLNILMNFDFSGKTHVLFGDIYTDSYYETKLCPRRNFVWDGSIGRCREVVCAAGYHFDEEYTTCVEDPNAQPMEVMTDLSQLAQATDIERVTLTVEVPPAYITLFQQDEYLAVWKAQIARQLNITEKRIRQFNISVAVATGEGNTMIVEKLDVEDQAQAQAQAQSQGNRTATEGESDEGQEGQENEQWIKWSDEGEKNEQLTRRSSEGEDNDDQLTRRSSGGEDNDEWTNSNFEGQENEQLTKRSSGGEDNDEWTNSNSEGQENDQLTKRSSEGEDNDKLTKRSFEDDENNHLAKRSFEDEESVQLTKYSSEGQGNDQLTKRSSEGELNDQLTTRSSKNEENDKWTTWSSEDQDDDHLSKRSSEGAETDQLIKRSSEGAENDQLIKRSSEGEEIDQLTNYEGENNDHLTEPSFEGYDNDQLTKQSSEDEEQDEVTHSSSQTMNKRSSVEVTKQNSEESQENQTPIEAENDDMNTEPSSDRVTKLSSGVENSNEANKQNPPRSASPELRNGPSGNKAKRVADGVKPAETDSGCDKTPPLSPQEPSPLQGPPPTPPERLKRSATGTASSTASPRYDTPSTLAVASTTTLAPEKKGKIIVTFVLFPPDSVLSGPRTGPLVQALDKLVTTGAMKFIINGTSLKVDSLKDEQNVGLFSPPCPNGVVIVLDTEHVKVVVGQAGNGSDADDNFTMLQDLGTGKTYIRGMFDVSLMVTQPIGDAVGNDTQEPAMTIYSALACEMPRIANGKCKRIRICGDEYSIDSVSKLLTFQNSTYNITSYEFMDDHYQRVEICVPEQYSADSVVNHPARVLTKNCATGFERWLKAEGYLTAILGRISIVALFSVLLTYALFPSLRNLPGVNTMSLTFALFLAEVIFITGEQVQIPWLCTAVAVALHYCFLASHCWMNVMSYDVFRTFAGDSCILTRVRDKKKFFPRYAVYAWGMPLLVIGVCLFIDLEHAFPNITIGYGGTWHDDGFNQSDAFMQRQRQADGGYPGHRGPPPTTPATTTTMTFPLDDQDYPAIQEDLRTGNDTSAEEDNKKKADTDNDDDNDGDDKVKVPFPAFTQRSFSCWIQNPLAAMFAFGAPILLIFLLNCAFFARTIASIRRTTHRLARHSGAGAGRTNSSSSSTSSRMKGKGHLSGRNDVVLYVKMSSVMGFTWVFGLASSIVSAVTSEPSPPVCYVLHGLGCLFPVLNSSQGLFIFFAFVFNRRVALLYRSLGCRARAFLRRQKERFARSQWRKRPMTNIATITRE